MTFISQNYAFLIKIIEEQMETIPCLTFQKKLHYDAQEDKIKGILCYHNRSWKIDYPSAFLPTALDFQNLLNLNTAILTYHDLNQQQRFQTTIRFYPYKIIGSNFIVKIPTTNSKGVNLAFDFYHPLFKTIYDFATGQLFPRRIEACILNHFERLNPSPAYTSWVYSLLSFNPLTTESLQMPFVNVQQRLAELESYERFADSVWQ